MEEKEDSRLEMVPLGTEDSLDTGAETPLTYLVDFRTSSASMTLVEPDELDSVELGMARTIQDVEGLSFEAAPAGLTSAAAIRRPVEKLDNVGGGEGNLKEAVKELVSRDLARVQKTEANDLISREALSSEFRASFVQNEFVGRGVGLVSDEDFDREFGSGGSGQSTPKRRNGSRGRSTGVSRMENGVGGESLKETILKGSLIDALKGNAVDLSPRSRNSVGGRDHDTTFLNDEVVPGSRPSSRNPLLVTILKTLFFILIWYTFSTCLTLYNKLLLGETLGKFPAPLLMNTIHFSMQAIISSLLVHFWCGKIQSPIRMTWKDYLTRVVPTAAATALDIDLSNISIVFISVSFATMVKSGAPVFLLLFAFAFKLEVPSFKLMGIIVVISFGVILTVAKETEFEVRGFILVLLAAVMSGFRWTVTQLLLQKEEYGLSNPFAAMSYLTPVMAFITLIFSLAIEPWRELSTTAYFDTPRHIFASCALMLLGGALAFFMVMAEYFLIAETSAVTLTIAGVVKEVVTIVVAVFFFHDEFTWLKGMGLVVIIIGVSLFNWFKYQKLVEGGLGHHAPQQEGSRSPLKYVIINDETLGKFELEDDIDHVL